MPKRRPRGEGGIYQRHDHPSCPPLIDGERADHRCQGRWVGTLDIRLGDNTRRRKNVYGRTKKEAQVKLAQALRDRDNHTLILASTTVESWMRYWLDTICVERGLKVNTLKSHRSKVEQYIIPHLGRHRLDRLAPEHIRKMYQAMRKRELAEATLRQTHAILHRALKVAVREGKAYRNVAELLDPPSTETEHREGLSLADARAVLRLAGWGVPFRNWLGLRALVALYLGVRQGEVLALRWSNIDFQKGVLQISRGVVRNSDDSQGMPKGLVLDLPKSKASRRYLPIPTVVLSRMAVAHAEWLSNRTPPTRIYDAKARMWLEVDDFVFHRDGKPIDHRADWQAWADLLKAAGVSHIALHAARNTTASLLEAAGVPDRMVAEILGHSSVQITHDYQAAEIERRAEAMRKLEAYVQSEPQTPPARSS